ncbi:hypothetical protein [Geothermobacter hydrogeniphilus]|uniref:hypothetical protein n=1 Tax=Geothermobacter hydrogeniphilus TaxID=1969733 RepID=UPI001E5AA435|nr:hypothetical protein [Geothermobacter hydrogeniphilus]
MTISCTGQDFRLENPAECLLLSNLFLGAADYLCSAPRAQEIFRPQPSFRSCRVQGYYSKIRFSETGLALDSQCTHPHRPDRARPGPASSEDSFLNQSQSANRETSARHPRGDKEQA